MPYISQFELRMTCLRVARKIAAPGDMVDDIIANTKMLEDFLLETNDAYLLTDEMVDHILHGGVAPNGKRPVVVELNEVYSRKDKEDVKDELSDF